MRLSYTRPNLTILHCSYHESYLAAEERCNEHGSYLADVLDQAENDFLKSVLRVVNPKDGTDYWYDTIDVMNPVFPINS